MNMRGASFITLLKLMGDIFRKKNSLWSQKILFKKTQIALFSFACYCIVLLAAVLLLSLIEKQLFLPLFFETTSALCTIGLSMGITPELSVFGKSLIALLMLTGRTGILIIGFIISTKAISWDRRKNQELVF
jgi:trk system potassium uptake protein TrkH